jgi:transposase
MTLADGLSGWLHMTLADGLSGWLHNKTSRCMRKSVPLPLFTMSRETPIGRPSKKPIIRNGWTGPGSLDLLIAQLVRRLTYPSAVEEIRERSGVVLDRTTLVKWVTEERRRVTRE